MLTEIKRLILGEDVKPLSPRNLLKPLRDCMERSRKQMPNGTANVHNRYTIYLSEADYTPLKPLLNETRLQLEQYLQAERDKRKHGPKGWPLMIELVRDATLKAGHAKIESAFHDPGAQPSEPVVKAPPRVLPPQKQEALPPTVVAAEDEEGVVVKTVLVGELPETQIIPQRRGKLIVESGSAKGQTFDLTHDEITVGREGDIVIGDDDEKPRVSRKHFTLTARGHAYVLTDTSTNGTFVNGIRVSGKQVLADRDVIGVGEIELRYVKVSPHLTGS